MTSDSDGVAGDATDAAPTGDGAGREAVVVGSRASAGSARAAARASAAKAAVTAGKGRPTRSRDKDATARLNIAQRIVRYLREVSSELRKVIWPTRNEMVTYSIVVVLFLIFMIAVTWGADFGFARLTLAIFG